MRLLAIAILRAADCLRRTRDEPGQQRPGKHQQQRLAGDDHQQNGDGRRAKVSGAEAARIMHERHEGMETIGKNIKAIQRELDAGSPDLARRFASSAERLPTWREKRRAGSPQGTGPDVGKTGAKPEIWQNPKDFAAKLAAFQKAAPAFDAAACRQRHRGDQGALTPTSAGPARLPRQIPVGDAPLSSADAEQPVWDLPVRLFHWLLAGLILFSWWSVEEPPHRLAHLVGLRDPDACSSSACCGGSSAARRRAGRASFAGRAPSATICADNGPAIGPYAARRAEHRRPARRGRDSGRTGPVRPG